MRKLSSFLAQENFTSFSALATRFVPTELIEYVTSNTMNELTRRINPFLWTYQKKVQIVAIHRENHAVKTFVLRPNQHMNGALPGQHLKIEVPSAPEPLTRYYSISSIRKDGTFTITVKRCHEGAVSNWLHKHAKIGTILKCSDPEGQFIYQGQEKCLFLSAGVGITPCYSIVDAIQNQDQVDIEVYAIFKRTTDLVYEQQMKRWPAHIKRHITVANSLDQQYYEKPFDLTSGALLKAFPDIHERTVYLCGPPPFMDKVINLLEEIKFNFDQLNIERFNFVAPAPGDEQENSDVLAEIRFNKLGQTVQMTKADQGKTVLEIAENHGIHLEHGCRSGMCGTCRTQISEGCVSGNQIGKVIYPCTCYPASERITLE